MVVSKSLHSHLTGLCRALATENAAAVRFDSAVLQVSDRIGDLAIGDWLAPFLDDIKGDFIVCDRVVAGDRFAEALASHDIRFFAASRIAGESSAFVCAFDRERRTLMGAQEYVLRACAGTLAAQEELKQLRGVYSQYVTQAATRDERLRLLESVVVNANDAVLITEASPVEEPGPRIRYANRAFTRTTGYELEEIVGKTPRILQGPATSPESRSRLREALLAWQPCEVELINYRKDGTPFAVELSIVPVADDTGWFTHWVSVQRDITDRKAIEEQHLRARVLEAQHDALAFRAFHDDLTGLRNRAYFMDRLGLVLQDVAARDVRRSALIFFDLDRFKIVNDSLGHNMGDLLLVELGRRLAACLQPSDTLARMGGDEFTVLVERVESLESVLAVADSIIETLRSPVRLGGQDLFAYASLGIVFIDRRYTRAEDVLRDADSAMYRAKRSGGMRYVCFDDSMYATAVASLALQLDLQRAVEREEFVVHYQPVIDIRSSRVTGIEALVRWNHPDRGLISPLDFIGTAEETGLITAIGEYVLKRACHDMRDWHARDPHLTLNVNVSPRQFHDSRFFDIVVDALADAGISPYALQLEITENLFLDRADEVGATLEALRAIGVRIALDDFGTGYSSLSYLERFEIDTLKIDKSFVDRIETSPVGVAIVRTVVQLARALGIKVVAEGVETAGQLDALCTFDCDSAQGYFFSRPIDAAMTATMLEAGGSSAMLDRAS